MARATSAKLVLRRTWNAVVFTVVTGSLLRSFTSSPQVVWTEVSAAFLLAIAVQAAWPAPRRWRAKFTALASGGGAASSQGYDVSGAERAPAMPRSAGPRPI